MSCPRFLNQNAWRNSQRSYCSLLSDLNCVHNLWCMKNKSREPAFFSSSGSILLFVPLSLHCPGFISLVGLQHLQLFQVSYIYFPKERNNLIIIFSNSNKISCQFKYHYNPPAGYVGGIICK